MVSVQDEAHIKGTSHRFRGFLTVEHPEEVRGDVHGGVGIDDRLPGTMTIEGRDHRRSLGDQTNRLASICRGVVDIGLRVVKSQGSHSGLKCVHRTGVDGEGLDQIDDAAWKSVFGTECIGQFLEFGFVGKPPLPEEKGGFLEN